MTTRCINPDCTCLQDEARSRRTAKHEKNRRRRLGREAYRRVPGFGSRGLAIHFLVHFLRWCCANVEPCPACWRRGAACEAHGGEWDDVEVGW